MPRPPRQETSESALHVTARGNNRQDIFLDDTDHQTYLDFLGQTVLFAKWRCLAYCLMTNHLHLLLETPCANLGFGMQRLQGRYAQRFNRRHARDGHLFKRPYRVTHVRDDAHLWMTVAYIARNPVDAGMCGAPGAWRWSSHGAMHAARPPGWLDHGRLLELLDTLGGDPRERYQDAVGPRFELGPAA